MIKRMGFALLALTISAALWGCGSGGGTGAPSTFSINPSAAALPLGASITFQASSPATFSVQQNGGSITAGGVYTAPRVPGTYTVVASNASNPQQIATAQVTVSASPVHVSINPTSATVLPGTTQAFTATVTGVADARATFSASAGSITTAGLFTAPTTPGTYTVTATSVVDPSQSATASVTVPNVVVALTPQTAILGPGGTQPFTATVSGTSNSGVIYSVQGANSGTITQSGVYTAPTLPGTYTVVATSAALASASATAMVTVTPSTGIGINISPRSVTVPQGGTQIFTAQVTGTPNSGATFMVQESNGGTITNTGVYTAPTTPGTYHVVVTSIADTSAKATAVVTVPMVGISLTSSAATVGLGQTLTITPVVTGTTNIGVTGSVVQGVTGGTVTAGPGNTLIYTAPNTAGIYTVTVTSAADPTQSATIQITVSQGPSGTGVVVIQ